MVGVGSALWVAPRLGVGRRAPRRPLTCHSMEASLACLPLLAALLETRERLVRSHL